MWGLPPMKATVCNAKIIKIQTTDIRWLTGMSLRHNAFSIAMTTDSIGAGCMKYFAVFPAGAVLCSHFRNYENCIGISRNCGNS